MADTMRDVKGMLERLAAGGYESALQRAAARLAPTLQEDARALAPVKTGKLRRSIKVVVRKPKYGRGWLMQIVGWAKYSAYVERKRAFLATSVEQNTDPIRTAILDEVEREIAK